MSEIESRTREIYSSVQRKTEMFTEGEFFCHRDNSYSATGKLKIKASYIEPTGEEYTVPQAMIHVKYSPYDGKEVEYAIDPNDFSTVSMKEEPIKGLLGKFIKPRTQANEKDLEMLDGVISFLYPTDDFADELRKGRQKVEEENWEIKRINRQIEEAIERREIEARKEDEAMVTSSEILEKITPDVECLGIVVDDYSPKFDGKDGLLNNYNKANIDCNISFHLLMESGEAIRVITHIQKQLKASGKKLQFIFLREG